MQSMKQVYAAHIRKVCFHLSTEVARCVAHIQRILANSSSHDPRVAICSSTDALYYLPVHTLYSILRRDPCVSPFSLPP